MLSIQTNVASLSAQKNLAKAQSTLSTSFNRLSSGLRINSAKDDAAGLALSESMRMQIRSYNVTERNANDGISMAQTAEGALGEVSNVLGRLRELATQGASGSITSTDRSYLQTEFSSLQSEISRILTSTKFNGRQLINQTQSALKFQVGIANSTADRITVTFGGVDLTTVAGNTTKVSGSAGNGQSAIDVIDSALTKVSTARARFGAAMVAGGVGALIHAVLPFAFKTTGSDTINTLHARLVAKRNAKRAATTQMKTVDYII